MIIPTINSDSLLGTIDKIKSIEGNGGTKTSKSVLSRRGLERLDLLLLVIESLDLNASEAMIWISEQIGLSDHLPNRVELWKLRCHNPLRRACRHGYLRAEKTDSLILLLCVMGERLYPLIHQLLSSREPVNLQTKRWKLFNGRFRDLLNDRMNTRLSSVQLLLINDYTEQIAKKLLISLAFSVGIGGVDRLKACLEDPNFYSIS